MNPLVAYLPIDRLHALNAHVELSQSSTGAVLFADVAGFTPLTSALVRELGARRGAEEVTRILNAVFEVLIDQVHGCGGSVVTFSGDAITCFFEEGATTAAGASARAVRAALQMHRAIVSVRSLSAAAARLSVRIAIEQGSVHRVLVGHPDIQLLEVLAGGVMDRLAVAARVARDGEIVAGPSTVRALGSRLHSEATLLEEVDGSYTRIVGLSGGAESGGWDNPHEADLPPDRLRPWLLPIIYQRLSLGQMDFLAELRPATVMFLQVRGFDFDREEHAGAKLHAFVSWVQKAVTQAEGVLLDVSAGNTATCLYIAFGAPVAHDDDAERAVETAMRLLRPPAEFGFVTESRIGIGHGRMRAGPYGSSVRRTYGVLGDQTNLAARLMEAAPSGCVFASDAVVDAAGGRERFIDRGTLTLKGRDGAVPVFEPQHRRSVNVSVGRRAAIVGREKERRLLRNSLDLLREGAGGVVFFEGEPGIGKSRLMGELAECATGMSLRFASGAAFAIERFTPYFIWRSVLAQVLLGTFPSDPSRFGEQLQAELHDRADLALWLPLLSGILPLDIAENEITAAMTSEVRAESTYTLLATLLASVAAREGGLVLALEDAHWIDSVSWALARRVCRDVPFILLVIAARPMEPLPPDCEALLQSSNAIRIRLEPLTPRETVTLATQRLAVEALPPAVAVLIQEKAQGNPFFAEELACALRDRGVIRIANERCEVAAGATVTALEFPDTIEGVVRSRLDKLEPSQQLLVKLASVIGRVFPFDVLSDIYPAEADRSRLRVDLDMLERLELVPAPTYSPELTYSFKHVIIQEVAYDLLLFAQKQELHRQVAQWYERAYTRDLSPHYPLLAHHWGSARVIPKTIHYLEKAGDHALEHDANEEARRFFGQAVQLADGEAGSGARDEVLEIEGDRRAQWDVNLGEAHHRMGLLAESEHHFRQGLRRLEHRVPVSPAALLRGITAEVLRQAGRRLRPFSESPSPREDGVRSRMLAHAAYERLAELSFLHGRSGLVVFSTLRSLNLAEGAGPSKALAHGYATVCVACGLLPFHPLARLYQRKAVALAELLDDAQARADVLLTTGVYSAGVGEFALAEQRVHEAMTLFERFGNFHRWGLCMQLLCRLAWSRGDFTRLSALTNTLQQRGQHREDVLQQIWGLNNQAEIALLRADDPRVTLDACEESLTLIAKCREVAAEIIARSLIAQAEIRRGNASAGLAAADAALALIANSPRPTSFGMLTAYAATADACLSLCEDRRLGRIDDLARRAGAALRSLKGFASIFPIGQPRTALYHARYLTLRGHQARAFRLRKHALTHATRLGMPYEAALAQYAIGCQLSDAHPQRLQYLVRARAGFNGLGARHDESRVVEALSVQ